MAQPELILDRLALRPATSADLDPLFALWTDAEVRRYLWDDRVITRDEASATLSDCLGLSERGLGLWTLHLAPGAAGHEDAPGLLGCAALLPASTAAEYEPRLAGLIEPLVALSPAVFGRGYAHEALAGLQEHAATVLGLDRLAAVTDVPNTASDRMLRRAGFVPLGETDGPRHRLRSYLWSAPRGGRSAATA